MPFQDFTRRISVALATGMLAACSPQHDWRQATVGAGQVRAIFPDKPQTAERTLDFEGNDLAFSLTSASAGGALYTVGYAELPDALRQDETARERLADQTRASLFRNLGAAPPQVMPAPWQRFVVHGESQGKDLKLDAVVWTTPDALIEGIVVGEASRWNGDQADEFFRELAPALRPAATWEPWAEAAVD